jgi:Protein of unknown function (DUF3306)
MTEEDFLARWSRRKRFSAAGAKPAAEAESVPAPAHALPDPERNLARQAEPAFDPATLPPIDSITAVSDISAFLQQGVPAELTRAALRRVWTADPAIREFVGLAENAWDFTDPNAMPGFGPLESSDEVRRMIADLVDRIGQAATPGGPDPEVEALQTAGNCSDSNLLGRSAATDERPSVETCAPSTEAALTADDQVLVRSNKDDAALQHNAAEHNNDVIQTSRRSHGGALPQ